MNASIENAILKRLEQKYFLPELDFEKDWAYALLLVFQQASMLSDQNRTVLELLSGVLAAIEQIRDQTILKTAGLLDNRLRQYSALLDPGTSGSPMNLLLHHSADITNALKEIKTKQTVLNDNVRTELAKINGKFEDIQRQITEQNLLLKVHFQRRTLIQRLKVLFARWTWTHDE